MDIPKSRGVYAIINHVTGDRYIGGTTNIAKRWALHVDKLRHDNSGIPKLQEAWNQYGEENFGIMVMRVVPDDESLKEAEQYFLDLANPEYNTRIKSNAQHYPTKQTRTPEQIERMRAAKANISQETRDRMSAAKLGKVPAAATLAAARVNRGKSRSPEDIEKIRQGQRERWARRKAELLASAKRDEQGRFAEK